MAFYQNVYFVYVVVHKSWYSYKTRTYTSTAIVHVRFIWVWWCWCCWTWHLHYRHPMLHRTYYSPVLYTRTGRRVAPDRPTHTGDMRQELPCDVWLLYGLMSFIDGIYIAASCCLCGILYIICKTWFGKLQIRRKVNFKSGYFQKLQFYFVSFSRLS